MSDSRVELASRTAVLRAEFDASFARAHPAALPPQQDLLAIKVGEHDYAVSLAEVVSLHADRRIVPLPSSRAALLGLVGLRGSVVPVYDLRQLLGYVRGTESPRWLMSLRTPEPFALAFERLDAHLRVARAELLSPGESGPCAAAFIRGSVATKSGPRPLLDLTALFTIVTTSERREKSPTPEETR